MENAIPKAYLKLRDSMQEKLEREQAEFYEDITWVDGVGFCALCRMLFTWGVLLDLDEHGNPLEGRFCFDDYWSAKLFLKEWDGATEPEVGKDGCTALKRSLAIVRNDPPMYLPYHPVIFHSE